MACAIDARTGSWFMWKGRHVSDAVVIPSVHLSLPWAPKAHPQKPPPIPTPPGDGRTFAVPATRWTFAGLRGCCALRLTTWQRADKRASKLTDPPTMLPAVGRRAREGLAVQAVR